MIMKETLQKAFRFLVVFIFLSLSYTAFADTPPPPPGGSGGAGGGTGGTAQQRNGASVGGGLFLLIGLAALYGGKKVYDYRAGITVE